MKQYKLSSEKLIYPKYYLLLFVLVFIACEDLDPDLRDKAIGTYTYFSETYLLVNDKLQNLGPDYMNTGIFTVNKGGTKGSLVVTEGSSIIIEGDNVASASFGFSFKIPLQRIIVDGNEVDAKGYDGIFLDSTPNHGTFLTDDNTLTVESFIFYFQYFVNGSIYVISFTGTKNL